MLVPLVLATLVGGLIGVGVYSYFLKRGHFDDPEEVKYEMFRDED